jgi:hypothetical protein
MRGFCIVTAVLLSIAGATGAADLCVTTSDANDRNISVLCGSGTGIPNLYAGYGATTGEICTMDGCPNPGGDCGCGTAGPFQWYVSRSATDPYDTVGTLSSNELYLWLTVCSPNTGWLAAEFGLDGTLSVQSFEPMNGFQSFGTGSDVMLSHASGCLALGDHLAGVIHLQSAVPVPGGVEAGSWGRTKAQYAE